MIDWGEEQAAHLLRRAAFGGTASEVARSVAEGMETTVERLCPKPGRPRAEASAEPVMARGDDLDSLRAIQRWWLTRMMQTRHPLEERMTFFWHDHFATSIVTVEHPSLMLQQNRLFRAHALGNMRELAVAVARDPAMLLWLDNHLSRKERPNENFGRELLELFLLGLGNYRESDVYAAVRSLTGWTLANDGTGEGSGAHFVFSPETHDDGDKTFLGHTGAWNGEDIVRIACAEPAHARFLVTKLFTYFAYPDPEPDVVERLATVYLDQGAELRPLVHAILTSPEMYSRRAMWALVKSPLDHALLACRQLQMDADPEMIVEMLDKQGLVLFNPPDVSGWNSGMAWINSWSLLVRMEMAELAAAQFDPRRFTGGTRFDSARSLVDFYLRHLGPLPVSPPLRERLQAYVASGDAPPERQRGLVHLILSSPEWQLN
jgi:uncharacterized protein (DUF1800 family)